MDVRTWRYLGIAAVVVFAAEAAPLAWARALGENPGLWPSTQLGLVLVLGMPDGRRWRAAMAVLLGIALAQLAYGTDGLASVVFGVLLALVGSWGGAEVVVRVLGPRPDLERSHALLVFCGLVAVVITPATAITGATFVAAERGAPWIDTFVRWYLPQLFMMYLVAPAAWVALDWRARMHRTPWRELAGRACSVALVVAAVVLVVVNPTYAGVTLPISIAMLPAMIFMALRYGVGLTAWAGIAVCVTLLALTTNGIGPFALTRAPGFSRNVAVELYSAVLAISTVLLAAVMRDARAAAGRLQAFLDTSSEPTVVVDTDLRVVAFSPAASRMFENGTGHPLQLGSNPLGVFQGSAETMARRTLGWQRALAGTSDLALLEPAEGARVEMRYESLRNAQGEIVGAAATAVDLVRRERVERERARAGRLESVGRLAGGIAHDINNLMTIVLGAAGRIRRERGPTAPTAAPVREIEDAVERAQRLTTRLLAFSSARPTTPRVFSLREQVDASSILLRRMIEERATVEVEHDPSAPAVRMDLGEFEQVLLNLAANSRDAMPDGGTFRIETGARVLDAATAQPLSLEPGPYATLVVSDTGTGIPPHLMADIFEPFFTTKGEHGTGLGLATVQAVVRRAGGAVTVCASSEAGTTFVIYLPRVVDAVVDASPVTPPPPAIPAGAHIVVCEDEPAIRELLARALEDEGYRVHQALTPDAALAHIADPAAAVDLLISDVVMPGMDGVTLLKAARLHRPALGVLLITGYADDLPEGDGGPDAPDAVLAKPFRGDALLSAVQQVLAARAVAR